MITREQLEQWLTQIEAMHPAEIELGLTRIKQVAEKLDVLNPAQKVILVAGTNGKGSVCAMLESLALQEKMTVGCYTSPHLVSFNERIRINGSNIDDQSLVDAFEKIDKIKDGVALTFFEFTTLAALVVFRQLSLDLAILEIGLGGRQDACNIVEPDVSLITTIAKDHTDWLGDDLSQIAYEKAGILRANKPAFVGDKPSFDLICSAEPKLIKNIQLNKQANNDLNTAFNSTELNPRMLLAQNILLAVAGFENVNPIKLGNKEIIQALKNIQLKGRFEQLTFNGSQSTKIILDVAHNPQSAQNLAKQLKSFKNNQQKPVKIVAVCGMMKDKSIYDVLTYINNEVNQWCFVDLPIDRAAMSCDLLQIYQNVENLKPADSFENIQQAFNFIQDNEQTVILVFGSFITVGNMVQYCQQQGYQLQKLI